MALPGFGGIWEILPRMFWEHTAFVPLVIFGQSHGSGGWFGGKGEEKGKEKRCQHFSTAVTTKTTKNSLVTLLPSALSLPPRRHSFLPSFLPFHLLSPCLLPFSTADLDRMRCACGGLGHRICDSMRGSRDDVPRGFYFLNILQLGIRTTEYCSSWAFWLLYQ